MSTNGPGAVWATNMPRGGEHPPMNCRSADIEVAGTVVADTPE